MHPLILYIAIRQELEAEHRRLELERSLRPPRHAPDVHDAVVPARRASRAAALTARLSRVLGRLRPRPA